MKTTQEIKDEYVKKVITFSQAKEAARLVDADGNAKDRSKDIYVTDLAAWDSYCSKKIYYDKVAKRSPPPEAVIRMTIGHVVHEIPLWDLEQDNGHEQGFTWNGIRCRMDEINFKEGIIVDKKTVPSLPSRPKDYVVKQLNIYKLIAEENAERPTKIHQLFVINMAVINGHINVLEVPIWSKEETKDFIDRTVKELKYHVDNFLPPNVGYNTKGWLCDSCQYTDLCRQNAAKDIPRSPNNIEISNHRKSGGNIIKIS
jgi:CRISPR/Cas system-associated exonuclease Cas4 (RecB family)